MCISTCKYFEAGAKLSQCPMSTMPIPRLSGLGTFWKGREIAFLGIQETYPWLFGMCSKETNDKYLSQSQRQSVLLCYIVAPLFRTPLDA